MTVILKKVSPFVRAANKDKRVRRLQNLRENGIYNVDVAGYITEIESLYSTRRLRGYQVKEVLQDTQHLIVEASLQETAFRSRIVEIKMRNFKILQLLEEHLESISRWLSTTYAGELRSEFSTIKARDEAIKFVLEDFYRLQHKLKGVIQLADLAINDFDQSSYRINHIIETVKIAFARERNI